jgi:uncharacterized membrane protein YdfJ with MMPL/SSD domain
MTRVHEEYSTKVVNPSVAINDNTKPRTAFNGTRIERNTNTNNTINIDMAEKLNNAIPVFAGVIVLLAFVLLVFVFRSILVPLKAVLGFV